MDLLAIDDVASVILFTLRASESELAIIADALFYLLSNFDDKQLYDVFTKVAQEKIDQNLFESPNEAREFVSDIFEKLMTSIKENSHEEYLEDRYKNWAKE